jgi:uncharacterized protein
MDEPKQVEADARVQWDIRIALRDGIRLNGILYMPINHAGRSPVIFTMTPYTAQTYHASALHYAGHGYPFLVVDVRGRGSSEGVFHPRTEAADGHDIVEWIANQPFCNGRVAMWGGSYGGYCQWATTKGHSGSLATIVPVASSCYGVDFPMKGNVFSPYAMQWLTLVRERASQAQVFADKPFWLARYRRWFESGIPFRQFDETCGDPSALFREWISHPHQDEYWDHYNPSAEDYAKLSIPILTITGAYDGDQLGALHYYREHIKNAAPSVRAKHFLVIGPWDHASCGTPAAQFGGLKFAEASVLDMRRLFRQWYAWTMQAGPRPDFLEKNVAYYVAGAEKWRYADSLEGITARSEALYVHSRSNPVDVFHAGYLSPEPPRDSDPDCYVHDPRDVGLADLEAKVDPQNFTDQRMTLAATGKCLIYHTAPFQQDVEISGFFRLSVWLAIDQPDTDFHVAIYEIARDGSAIRLAVDWMRARYRQSLRTAKLVDSSLPLRYEFERFTFACREVPQGNRLRLVIGPAHSIHFEKNYNSGGVVAEESVKDARVVTVKLFHDPSHPTALYVPYGQPDTHRGTRA